MIYKIKKGSSRIILGMGMKFPQITINNDRNDLTITTNENNNWRTLLAVLW